MNALVIIDTDALTPATVFAPGGVEGIISKLETDVRAIDRDISTPDGREDVKKLAYKIARSKTALDDMGKELVAGIKAQAATIDAERRIIRDRLDALKEEVRGPLTAWEDEEKARVDGHERAIIAIVESARFDTPPSAATIRDRISDVRRFAVRGCWDEFHERADAACTDAFARLEPMLDAAEQAERDQAELAELRQLKAEREEADRKAAEAEAAAEQARLIEEARAAREAKAREDREAREQTEAENRELERAERAEQAEADKAAAVAKAIEDEQRRAAAKEAAEQERQRIEAGRQAARAANKKHQAKVQGDIVAALMSELKFTQSEAADVVTAIAASKIPHVSITY